MPDQTPPTPSYTMGYSEDFQNMLRVRSVETHAKHLLQRLKPVTAFSTSAAGRGTYRSGWPRR